jgi:glycosyltransferase involved in cell wall biosynthesis
MSFLDQICVVVLTYNEAPNIERSLRTLARFPEVVLLDSGSTDGTLELASAFPNVRLAHRPFDNFANQWNHAFTACGIAREWVLALDADYLLPDVLVDEMDRLDPENDGFAGYRAAFRYCVFGRPLSTTLYPPLIVLCRRASTHYVQDGHCMRAQITGSAGLLKERISHDDRKPLDRWLSSQGKYAVQEAALLLSTAWGELKIQDKLRRTMVVTPWLVPLYCLTVGRGILDGWAGIFYAFQRGIAEGILAVRLLEIRLRGGP